MSSHRLLRTIRAEFPETDTSHVLSVLESEGKSRTIARHVRDFLTILHVAQGDLRRVVSLVTVADVELENYRNWVAIEATYKSGPTYLAHFSEYIVPLAQLLVPRGYKAFTSCGSLVVSSGAEELFYVVPLLGESAF